MKKYIKRRFTQIKRRYTQMSCPREVPEGGKRASIPNLLWIPAFAGMTILTSAIICVQSATICVPSLHAMNAPGLTTRDEVIETTLNGLAITDEPTELAPIRIKAQGLFRSDEYALARALHLYNQRRLTDARGDLKEVLIENPDNPAASAYLAAISSKLEAVTKSRETLEEEIKGIASVEQAQLGRIYGKEEFGNTEGQERFTTNTTVAATRVSQKGEDWTNKSTLEAMKLEGSLNDYKYTATANINYYNKDGKRDDIRLRNATWWMQNEKVQFILGDTSSYLSRYILNGVNYRGVNLTMNLYESMFGEFKDKAKVLYGKVPYFWLTEDEYIYPRDILAVRNEMDLREWWDLNTTFAYIWDSDSRIKKIDTNNKAKQNGLLGIDEVFRLLPGIWTLYHETALSYADDDRASDNKILKSWATYLVSDFKLRKIKFYNSYERIDPDFRQFTGLTGFFANKQVTINREHILNAINYTPDEEVDLGLQYSKTRTNLNKSYNVETIEEENYKANLKVMPKNGLPTFTLRGSVWTSSSTPGTPSSPKEQSNWDTIFGLAKTISETDLKVSLGLRGYSEYVNETKTFADALSHTFSLSANRKLFDRITLTPSYTYSWTRLKEKPQNLTDKDNISNHLFDLSLSSWLWDTANLTFDYNFAYIEELSSPYGWDTNHGFTTTFSWPFTANIGIKKKLVFSPYLSYHYSTGKATLLDRTYFSSRLEGDYFLTENTKLNLSGEYRDNAANDPTYVGFGDEYRVILSYKTVSGF